jgi:hypothetical protein
MFTPFVAVASWRGTASPALAQSRSWEGSIFPVEFDATGVRHYFTYGYYGPLVPPIVSQNGGITAHFALMPICGQLSGLVAMH